MAIIYGTAKEVFGFTTPIGPYKSTDAAPQDVFGCYVTVEWTVGDTYATADDFSLLALETTIQDARRNGKTVILTGVAAAQPGLEATAAVSIGMPTSIASGVILVPLTGGDLVTEHTGAVMGAMNRPMCWFVSFKEV